MMICVACNADLKGITVHTALQQEAPHTHEVNMVENLQHLSGVCYLIISAYVIHNTGPR